MSTGNAVASILARLQLDISSFQASIKQAQQEAEQLPSKMNLDKISSSMDSAGRSLTRNITLPIVAAGAGIAKVSADFEAGMSKVQALSAASAEDMEKLRDAAKEMGRTTKFSATESSEALQYMAQAGWTTEQMLAGLPGVMNLAAADGLDLATTSDIVTDALTAFGLQASDSAHFADVLAVAAAASNTDVRMMGETFKYVAPVAGTLGYTIEDCSVAIGLMSNNGIKAGQAGTALRGALSRMVKPTDAVAGAMEKYGISITNADGSMKTMDEFMQNLRTSLSGLDEATKANALSTLFGQEAMSGMAAIVNTTDETYDKLTDQIGNADGAAKKMADTMNDNFAGQLTLLKSNLESLGISLGEALMPMLKGLVGIVDNVVSWLNSLDEVTKGLVVTVGLFAAAAGPVLIVLSKMIKAYQTVHKTVLALKGSKIALAIAEKAAAAASGVVTAAQWALNAAMSANPITVIIIAITALVAAFGLLWVNSEEFRVFFTELWNSIQQHLQKFWDWLCNLFSNVWEGIKAGWEAAVQGIRDLWQGLVQWFEEFKQSVMQIFQFVCDFITTTFSGAITGLEQLFEGVAQFFTGIWEVIKNVFMGALLAICDLVILDFDQLWLDLQNIWTNICDGFGQIWQGIQNIFAGSLTFISDLWNTVWTAVSDFAMEIWTNITTWLSDVWETISTNISNAWSAMCDTVASWVTNIYNTIVQWFQNAVNWISNLPSTLYNAAVNMFTRMRDGVVNTVTSVVAAVKDGIQAAIDWILELPGQALTWGRDMIDGFAQGIADSVGAVIDGISDFADGIRSFLHFSRPDEGPLRDYETWMPDFMEGMARTLHKSQGTLLNVVKTVSQGIADSMQPELQVAANFVPTDAPTRRITKIETDSEDIDIEDDNDSGDGKSLIIKIEKIEVRDDEDIEKLTRGIYNKDDRSIRAMGRKK